MAKQQAIIYVRQSVAKEESISLEVQEAACREYAKAKDYDVREVIKDPGISGLQFAKRPGIRRAITAVEDREADVILCWRWSRLSRKRTDQAVILDRIEKAGGRAESALEQVDATTAGGKFSREVLLAVAAFESDTKSEQWKEAAARRISNGLPAGGAVRFGYQAVPKQADAKGRPIQHGLPYAVDPVAGPALRQAYLDYIDGAGFQTIVKRMVDAGVTTPRGKQITTHSLINVMDAGFAAGFLVRRVDGEQVFDRRGVHEALISEAEWDDYRRERAKRSIAHPKLRTAKWHLAGIVRCGLCGGPMIVNSYSREKSQALCSRYKSQRNCPGIWIYREFLEHRVSMWLGGRVDDLARHGYNDADRVAERRKIERSMARTSEGRVALDAALGKLASGWATGVLDDVGYQAARADLEGQRAALDRELDDLRGHLARLLPADADVYERLIQAGQGMDTGEWNGLLRRVIDRVEVGKTTIEIVPVAGEVAVFDRMRPARLKL